MRLSLREERTTKTGEDGRGNSLPAFPFQYQLIFSNRRTLSVSVGRKGEVKVRAPLRCPMKTIEAFLKEKSTWVESKVRAAKSSAREEEEFSNIEDGARFLWLGEAHKMCLFPCECGGKFLKKARFVNGVLYLPEEGAKTRLIAFFKEEAKKYLEEEVKICSKSMGASYRLVSVNGAKTRWGSCSYNDALHFSYRLMYAPKEVVRYVVFHELAHTFEKNHSKNFWAIVERCEPNYKKYRAFLKEHAYYMEMF